MLLVLLLALGPAARGAEPSSGTVQYRVWEEQPSGTRVGRLADELRQREGGRPLEDFQLVEQGKPLPFSVGARDGLVRTEGRLDREALCRGSDRCELAFSVLFRRSGAVSFLRVRVEVLDLNDHGPAFPAALQEVEISEMAGPGMRIPLDRASDPDAGPNGLQTYSLSANRHFALDVTAVPGGGRQAELVVVGELDREVRATLDLTLVAWDRGTPPRSGSTLVRVNILDSNDNSPTFEDARPTAELPEDAEPGATVIRLRASDPDQGPNGEVEYLLSGHAAPEVRRLFSVDPRSGAVSLRAPLDREARASYAVPVQARDRGPNAVPTHCELLVRLRDVNDNAPRIHVTWTPAGAPGAAVPEGAPEDTFLALVTVSDADSGERGRVALAVRPGSGPFRLKRLQGDDYMLVTGGGLDREAAASYNVSLRAQDHGDPPLACVHNLAVRVLDENDNAPVFSRPLYSASFRENNAAGRLALTVVARDADLELSGRVSYFLRSADEAAPFSVHPTSGAVRARRPLDYEACRSYSFTVEAVDRGHPPLTGTAAVIIAVQDVNDNRPVIREPEPRGGVASLSVPVDTDKGEIVTALGSGGAAPQLGFLASTLRADDADSGPNGRLSYLIAGGNPDGLFWLDGASGRLFVNATNATALVGRTFSLTVAVADGGSPSLASEAALQVTFTDLRDHLKNSSPGAGGRPGFGVMMAACLGAACLLLLAAVAVAAAFCRPVKRERRAYNCRQAESAYDRHPRRPQRNIRKADIRLVPVIRGRRDEPPGDGGGARPQAPPPMTSDEGRTEYPLNSSFRSRGYPEGGAARHCGTPRTPGNTEPDAAASHCSTSSGHREEATLRRPDAQHRQTLRNLVRLSMAAFGDAIELSAASPDVQQISQLLSLLHQGELHPRPNFRGNKYSHRHSRYGGQDCSDWLSTKDSGHGESEAGDVDWEPGRDSPLDPELEEALNMLNDDVSWMSRLSVPLSAGYHDNVFFPNAPPSTEDKLRPPEALDSSSFSTFGKKVDRACPVGGALLCEVSALFELLMTHKAGAPQADAP
ncbi:protocadherin-12 isoform X1 [Pseudoliparis swirei]|uniref:protocadherin-12 isoform X1 n=1 Tax=Pseudoliparis swirei TaxID=2059687 RepID=UPI0024BEDE6D|nr:protocadherin-12 isoform X1 [Pseudoliparis swirei]